MQIGFEAGKYLPSPKMCFLENVCRPLLCLKKHGRTQILTRVYTYIKVKSRNQTCNSKRRTNSQNPASFFSKPAHMKWPQTVW